jgi:cytochrome oxidase Cu insertion factor (SCO1/SenC/PrrC family)
MSDAAPRKQLTTLWLIVALTVAPVAASYLLYFFWQPEGRVNYGRLIEPHALPDPSLELPDGTPFRLSQLRGKWLIAMWDSASCDANCDRKLLYMRQLRLTQGKNTDRIERVWLLTDDATLPAGTAARYEGTWIVKARGTGLIDVFSTQGGARDHIYLIDPLGNLMLRFPRDPDPKLMIKDLSRLLKASQIG